MSANNGPCFLNLNRLSSPRHSGRGRRMAAIGVTREGLFLTKRRLLAAGIPVFMATAFALLPLQAGAGAAAGNLPQGTQTNDEYAASYGLHVVTNVSATTQKVSCYRPEVPVHTVGEARGYPGMTSCERRDNTGENTGTNAYTNAASSPAGYPAPRTTPANQ